MGSTLMAYEAEMTEEPDDEVEAPEAAKTPIELLAPGSELHAKVLKYLEDRLKLSEDSMSKFYNRWRVNEKKIQGYIDLPDHEKILKEMSKKGEPPNPVHITVPYSFATIWTITTYLVHTFCGRKPIFQVASYSKDHVEAARNMETMLQYNADRTRLVKYLTQYFLDGGTYGVGILRVLWKTEKKIRTTWLTQSPGGMAAPGLEPQPMQTRQERVVYEGNDVISVDPFMFFPDPRVPMTEVNRKGEFVFWRSYESEVHLKKAEAQGNLRWTNNLGSLPENAQGGNQSNRHLLSDGEASPGSVRTQQSDKAKPYHQIDQGTVEIIPSELGLGGSNIPEKWIFSIANRKQIIQAEPFDADHDLHPVAIIEPNSFGYGFGQPGMADFLGPIQDTLSWFINSHVFNVRSTLNNSFVYDPSMVEEQDLASTKPGKRIRLKRTAYGQDVRNAVQQLNVVDVTRGHVNDMQLFMRMGDSLSAVNDNLRGLQEQGGRKTATEVRTSGEAGASRLAAQARLISAQGIVDLAELMCVNIQQYQTMEFYLQVLGSNVKGPTSIIPASLAGDFYFPVHDGTLPLDRVALFDVWKEIMVAIMQSPQLQMQFPLGEIFKHVAKLGGAEELENFEVKLQVAPPPGGVPPEGVPGAQAQPG